MAEIHRKRTRKFTVHLLDEELAILDAKADETGLSKSEYIRNMILYGAPHRITNVSPEDTRKFLFEMNRIGNNLNQIAAYVNSAKKVDSDDIMGLRTLFEELYDVVERYVKE